MIFPQQASGNVRCNSHLCMCMRVKRARFGVVLRPGDSRAITNAGGVTLIPTIGGAERRARKRASSWSMGVLGEGCFDICEVGANPSAVSNLPAGKEDGVSA